MRVIVEVHDVEPDGLDALKAILRELDALGATPRVLLVIPEPLESHPRAAELVEILRQETGKGSEIVMHGYDHRVAGRLLGKARDVARGRLFAPAAAEFLSIDEAEARRRLKAGRAILEDRGLRVAGFCAPGWLEQPWLPSLLSELGFDHDVGMSALRDLRRRTTTRLRWAGNVGAGRAQEALVAIGAAASAAVRPRAKLIKVFIHPAPAEPHLDRRVRRLIERELRTRRPATYTAVLDGA